MKQKKAAETESQVESGDSKESNPAENDKGLEIYRGSETDCRLKGDGESSDDLQNENSGPIDEAVSGNDVESDDGNRSSDDAETDGSGESTDVELSGNNIETYDESPKCSRKRPPSDDFCTALKRPKLFQDNRKNYLKAQHRSDDEEEEEYTETSTVLEARIVS